MRRSDADKPMPPLNVMGDYAAGGLLLAFGVLAALNEAKTSGKGQVVDTAMTDGLVLFSTLFHGLFNMGQWSVEPGINVYETSAPYYDVYRTRDDRFLAVGAIEPNFFANLLAAIGADDIDIKDQHDRSKWPQMKRRLEELFATRTQQEWINLFVGKDVCVTPVLSMSEARNHDHFVQRRTFVESHGHVQPAPAPRFSRTPSSLSEPPPLLGEHSVNALNEWGFSEEEVQRLVTSGIVHLGKENSDE